MEQYPDLRMSSASVHFRPDRGIDFDFNCPKGRVHCVLTGDAVKLMAKGSRGLEGAWLTINRDWSDQLVTIAGNKYSHGPIDEIIIDAGDLTQTTRP
ncbi:MAG: hypothetical protein ABWY00_03480 [Dongiaceae bacterium]